MKVKGIQVQLDTLHHKNGARIERIGVLPININTQEFQYITLRLEILPEQGGTITQFLDLSYLKDEK